MVLTSSDSVIIHKSALFTLKIKLGIHSVSIHMQLLTSIVNTRNIPQTYSILKKMIPSVLDTICYNDLELPFNKEVKATEIGHLFEHILLENLCIEKIKNGQITVEFNGNTKWNWVINPYGSFEISVDSGFEDIYYLVKALKKTIFITEKILQSKTAPATFIPQPESQIPEEPRIWLNPLPTPPNR